MISLILSRPWLLKLGAILLLVAFVALSLLRIRKAGEAAGRAAERLIQLSEERDARKRMDKAGADARRDGAARRLRDGTF